MKKIITIVFIISVVSAVTAIGYFTSAKETPKEFIEANIFHTEPVDYSFEEIKKRGTIRMITRYGSTSFFLYRGFERGFEYDFLTEFARNHGLRVEVVILQPNENPIDVLNRGDGDIIAANYTITTEREKFVAFSQPYNVVDQLVVLPKQLHWDGMGLRDLEQISIAVRRNSSYYHSLRALKDQGFNLNIQLIDDDWDTEALILAVSEGRFEATVADHNLFQAASLYIDGIVQGPIVAEGDQVAWAIRNNDSELKEHIDTFLNRHFRINQEDLQPRRSAFLNVLRRRYFEDDNTVRLYRDPQFDYLHTGQLSPYDNIVRPFSDSAGVDWRLVIAVMSQESRFDPNAKSWMGAVGLMQILPRFSQVPTEELLFDPETNIKEGIRYIRKHLDRYSYLDTDTQIRFALANYNAGIGHVTDARRLTIELNGNPNHWPDVAVALLMLMNRQYYQNARFGFVRGIETVTYVDQIMYRYQKYQSITLFAENSRLLSENRSAILLPLP